ncbi:MAG TPA: tetratricopeptide repeat protein, partial [Bryobacteraceae bacterium]|nr:tetratricopeptide repeat protein [Bryobacteraceae bacterium]
MTRTATILFTVLAVLGPPAFSQPPVSPQQQIQAHTFKAQQALKAGNPAEAIAELNAVLALDPNNFDARANVGVLQFFQGDSAKAAGNLRAALKAKP